MTVEKNLITKKVELNIYTINKFMNYFKNDYLKQTIHD